MTYTIRTNNRWRQFVSGEEVPAHIMHDQFDYLDADMREGGFFKYKNWWYHLSDFDITPSWSFLHQDGWHGYTTDTFFSGVAIRITEDGDQFQVATWSV